MNEWLPWTIGIAALAFLLFCMRKSVSDKWKILALVVYAAAVIYTRQFFPVPGIGGWVMWIAGSTFLPFAFANPGKYISAEYRGTSNN